MRRRGSNPPRKRPVSPLAGWRVVVTRPQPGTGRSSRRDPLVRLLRSAGARVAVFPTLVLRPPLRWGPVDRALRSLRGRCSRRAARSSYAWIVFLSAHAVERFLARARSRRVFLRRLRGVRLAAIGPSTARALRRAGMRPAVVAREATSEGLARALRGRVASGDRVLLPRTDIGSDALPRMLRQEGIVVDEVVTYRSLPVRGGVLRALRRELRGGTVEAVLFTSAQAARNFAAMVGPDALRRMAGRVRVASIGPATSAACRAIGMPVDAEARTPSFRALVRSLIRLSSTSSVR